MPNIKRLILVTGTSAVLAVTTLTGCQMMNGHEEGGRTAGRVLDDKQITETVKGKLANQPVYKFTDVGVQTYDGIVQLNGFVATQDQKQMASQIAQRVDGVRQVINNLALKPNANQLTPTGSNNPNGNQNGAENNQINQGGTPNSGMNNNNNNNTDTNYNNSTGNPSNSGQ